MTASLCVVHVTGERGFSGGEVQVFLLMEGLRKRGHRNVLVCPPGSESGREASRRGIEHVAVRMRNAVDPAAWIGVWQALRRYRPDVVHLHTGRANWSGALAAATQGIPAISTRRMDRRVRPGVATRVLYERLLRRVVAISPAVGARLLAAGVPEDRVRVVWSAVDPDALHPRRDAEAVRGELGVGSDTLVVLVAAGLVRRKGIDVLLDAFGQLPAATDAALWIAGDGPERADLERRARGLATPDRVHFLGRRDDVPDLLAACDVFALPSRQEGLGVAALEAMACARPVVASDVGGLGEIVVHEHTGLLVAPDDPAALARALARLVSDASLRSRLGESGPSHIAEHYLAEGMTAAYESIYREVCAQ